MACRELKGFLDNAINDPSVGLYVSQILEQVGQFEATLPSVRRKVRAQNLAIPFEPPKIVVRAFGEAAVSVEGKLLANADWQVMGARDLFFYLISNPDGASKGTIGLTFWPDKSPEQLKSLFKSTIHRLRQALKQEVVIYQNDRYSFNQSTDYEYDVDIFLTLLAQAKQTGDASRRAQLYREAIALYKGYYLSDVDGSWVMPERERLWQLYVEAVLSLANHHLEKREYPLCLDYCWRALQKDPTLEEAHRLIMRTHAAMGNRAWTIKQYDECHQVLKNMYNTRPSPATEKLYQNLIQ
jgi:two-component SAPR family response regulator